ncbi:MAG: carbon-nitrogen hydrolase family protein [Gudongella sp.]|nr:carbon-nitrogen hydrolase family protein [Gudongella sp.]
MTQKIALIQMKVVDDKKKNLETARNHINEAVKNGAKVIILPEMFNTPYDNKYFPEYAEEYPGETAEWLKKLSKKHEVTIVGGSIPEKDGYKIYNTSYVFSDRGELIAKHRKIHLFDISVEGKIFFKESDVLTAGDSVTLFESHGIKFGLIICYDIRFPELARKLVLEGAEAIIVPAAFNMTTGPAHWHLTARARALDNQVYTLLCSQSRNENASYLAYGHSLAANPWGEIIDELQTEEGILYIDIDLEFIKKVREELPLLKHRKPQLYI